MADHHPFHIEAVADGLGKAIDDRLSGRRRQERICVGGFKRFRTSESECVVPFCGHAQAELPRSFGVNVGDDDARHSAEGDNTLTFTGAETFEAANADALSPPTDGQTVIYHFTETVGDRLYVERKVVGYAI